MSIEDDISHDMWRCGVSRLQEGITKDGYRYFGGNKGTPVAECAFHRRAVSRDFQGGSEREAKRYNKSTEIAWSSPRSLVVNKFIGSPIQRQIAAASTDN
jgi:hypothetical protein